MAIAATAVVALAYPLGAESSERDGTILVSAPASSEACAPCHPAPGTADGGRIIFDHAAHLLAACTSCHTTPAHEGGGAAVPTMDSCFACHGLIHGPIGLLASAECADCHPSGFELRPVSHVEDWEETPHAEASAGGVNRCLMCHEAPADCDACHRERDVDVPALPNVYLSTLPKVQMETTVTVDPSAPVSMGQCVYCHPDIGDFQVGGLVFGHDAHLQRAYRCEACHEVFPHGTAGTERPDMGGCMRCHGLEHASQGQVADPACLKCHTVDFELVPQNHTVSFLSGEHNSPAREDAAYCSQCHAPQACVQCHNGGVELANGSMSEKVIPEDHRKPEWRADHGANYLAQRGMCVVCHTSDFCQQCHQTTMPHPVTWLSDHTKGNGSLANDCTVCHADRESCQNCHHDTVRAAALIPENCVSCHEEMDTDKPTEIDVPGLAEHAVHFSVADPDKKGEPYYCDDCHIGFGSTGIRVMSQATGPHDMRLCYECHGALDFQNQLIAPYRGAELCLRCHPDLI